MTKKMSMSMIIIVCLSFLVVAGCAKIWKIGTIGASKNLQNCQSLCDKQAVLRGDQAATAKATCYNNCEEIDAISKWSTGNVTNGSDANEEDTATDEDTTTTTDEETTTTEEETLTNADCDVLCRSSIWLAATAEERKSCALSCKAGVKLWSKSINDCDGIEALSEGLMTKDSCIATKAVAQKKPEFCANISDAETKDGCYIALAQDSQDKSICNNIKNEENRNYCNIIITQE